MFSSGTNYTKLKTHLRLAINRLKLLEKKKTELAQKARKEIADYIAAGKYERAKIRVEHIIREDYLVEAFECVEMYCDLLLARFGLIQQMKTLDDGLAEPISSILWVSPRIQADIQEMKVISDMLTAKYGKPYAEACRDESVSTISEKLRHKMNVHAPPKLLVEKYLIEIAKNYNIAYEPDPQVMREETQSLGLDAMLLDLDDPDNCKNNLGGSGGGGGGGYAAPQPGFVGFPLPPMPPQGQPQPFNYPSSKPSGGAVGGFISPPVNPGSFDTKPSGANTGSSAANAANVALSYNIPPGSPESPNGGYKPLNNPNVMRPEDMNDRGHQPQGEEEAPPPPYSSAYFPPDLHADNNQAGAVPKPQPRAKLPGPGPGFGPAPGYGSGFGAAPNFGSAPAPSNFSLPELPSVPTDSFPPGPPAARSDDIDFDDLTRRFEDLKKKK